MAQQGLKNFKEAIKDFDKASESDKKMQIIYVWRGTAKRLYALANQKESNNYYQDDAMNDYTSAIFSSRT